MISISEPSNISWDEAQDWCHFVLFKPTWLPLGLTETSNKVRKESPQEPSCHRATFERPQGALSIKQFLYDWAPPAYDHPCLWRNAKISTPENTPLPKPYLIANNYLWFGLDYRRKLAATINMMRTQIEITVLDGRFDDQEMSQIVEGLTPVSIPQKNAILKMSFAELMFNYRHLAEASPVPTSYFAHTRLQKFKCYPYSAKTETQDFNELVGNWLMNTIIENYILDSLFLFGEDKKFIQEVEYYFESSVEPGSYIRFLVTQAKGEHVIKYPPLLGDQECRYVEQKLDNGKSLFHAWSKTNDNGSHSLIFKIDDVVINCIVKPAPWTTVDWVRALCYRIINNKVL